MYVSLQTKNPKCWLCEKCKITTRITLDNYSYLCARQCPLPFLQLELLSRGWGALNPPPVPPKFLRVVKSNCPSKVTKLGTGEKYLVSSVAYWEWLHCRSAVVQTADILSRHPLWKLFQILCFHLHPVLHQINFFLICSLILCPFLQIEDNHSAF